jgi:pyridoxine kinase
MLEDLPSLRRALKIFHEEYRVPNVVITSVPVGQWPIEMLPQRIRPCDSDSHKPDFILCLSSSVSCQDHPTTSLVHARCVPRFPGYFGGVGDLFSALLLGHFQQADSSPPLLDTDTPLSLATSLALLKTHAVLRRTYEHAQTLPEDDRQSTDDEKDAAEPSRLTRRLKGRELRLVQSQDILRGTGTEYCQRLEPWATFWTS